MVHTHTDVFWPLDNVCYNYVRDGAKEKHNPRTDRAQLGFTDVPPSERADGVHRPSEAIKTDQREEDDAAVYVDVERDFLKLTEDLYVFEVWSLEGEVEREGEGKNPG